MGQLTVARPRAFSPRGPEPRWHWQLRVEATASASGAQCQWAPGPGGRFWQARACPLAGALQRAGLAWPATAAPLIATDARGLGEALSTWHSPAAAPGPVVSYSLALCSEARAQSPTWKLRLQSKSGVSFMRTTAPPHKTRPYWFWGRAGRPSRRRAAPPGLPAFPGVGSTRRHARWACRRRLRSPTRP